MLGSPPLNLKIYQNDNNNNNNNNNDNNNKSLLALPYLDGSSFFNQEASSKLRLTLFKGLSHELKAVRKLNLNAIVQIYKEIG